MTTTTDNDASTVQTELAEPDFGSFLARLNRIPGVQTEPRDAVVCGAYGCRCDEHLAQVSIDGFGKRVVCPAHAVDLVERETMDGDDE